MEYKLDSMGKWERQKAMFLIEKADDLGMNISGYGEISVNPNSGYTYLWSEDYPFTLYMPINCELKDEDVWVMWTDPNDGEEHEDTLDEFETIDAIYAWVEELEKASEEK